MSKDEVLYLLLLMAQPRPSKARATDSSVLEQFVAHTMGEPLISKGLSELVSIYRGVKADT